MLICLVARAAAVFPMSWICNMIKRLGCVVVGLYYVSWGGTPM